jgi:acyl dehydratase
MAFSHDRLIGLPPRITRQTLTQRDTILYALGVGAGIGEPESAPELRFVYERELQALPTMAIVLAAPGFWFDEPALEIDWPHLVNAGQDITLHAPLPVQGDFYSVLTIDNVYDKGKQKGALVCSTRRVYHADDTLLATVTQTHLLRANGGFGGVDQPKSPPPADMGSRPPDAVVDLPTRPEQALLYRLSGDYNRLHIDPEIAHAAGFARPILHGSCTYGIAGRAVLHAIFANQPHLMGSFGARFSSPVYPGETIRTEIWRAESDCVFRCRSVERGVVVLDRGHAGAVVG